MDIEKAREARDKLEKDIANLLVKFNMDTDLVVTDIAITNYDVTEVGATRKQVVLAGVTVDVVL